MFKSFKTQRFIVIDLICLVINLSYHVSNSKPKLKKIETLNTFLFCFSDLYIIDELELHIVHPSSSGDITAVRIAYKYGNPDPFLFKGILR